MAAETGVVEPYPKLEELLRQFGDADDVLFEFARLVLAWQIKQIDLKPSQNRETANARARDARTLNELVRTLERLEALEKSRKASGRKTKVKHDADLKAALIRRMDQLLAAERAREAAAKSEQG